MNLPWSRIWPKFEAEVWGSLCVRQQAPSDSKPFPSNLRDFPNPGIEPRSLALQVDSLPTGLSRKPKPVNPKGNQYWIFTGRVDAEAEVPILWPPDAKNWLIGKDPDVGKDGRQEEKGTTEDEMVGWRLWLNGHEFVQALGVGDGQGSPACCSPWGCKELNTTERLNWTELRHWVMTLLSHF